MDINSAAFENNPRLMYLYLTGVQRMAPLDALRAVQARYGAPKSRQQLAEEQASRQQTGAIAQTVGGIGGYVVGQNLPDWLKQGKEALFPSGGTTPSTTTATPPGISATPTTSGIQGTPVPKETFSQLTADLPPEALTDPGFMSSVNWEKVQQGGLTALQAYQAYKAYKSGDTVGAGISGLSAGANAAQMAGLLSTTPGSAGAYVVPGLNIAAGAYQGYKTSEALADMPQGSQRTRAGVQGGAASGAAIGTAIMPGVGTVIGAGIGAVVGGIGALTGSGKGKAQWTRDKIREVLQKGNILDADFQGTLADGTKYDFGKDGSTLKWKNISKIANETPEAWNAALPLADALATGYGFVGQKASDISAWYAKAGISNANNDPNIAKQNLRHFAKQQGITFDQIRQKLDEAKADNRINDTQYNYYLAGAQDLTGGAETGPAPRIERPKKGEVRRVSAGLYRTDTGRLQAASSMRQALERAYGRK